MLSGFAAYILPSPDGAADPPVPALWFPRLLRAVWRSFDGIVFAPTTHMPVGMHSYTKEQREAVRHLLHTVLMRDMGSFTPERFKEWIKEMDAKFRKVALCLAFHLHNRSVSFTIKEIRSGRTAFRFTSATRVRFDDREVVMSADELLGAR